MRLNGDKMQNLIQLLKLTRLLNLVIIALTMWLMRRFVLKPMVEVNDLQLQMQNLDFFLLVLSTVLIAAAGNVINDYFDQRTDRVNKPAETIVGVHISRRIAMATHQVFNFMGIVLAVWVAWRIGMWKLSIISLFAAGSLWFYSVQFKRDLFTGNLIIALLAGLVPLIVGIYEVPLLIKTYGEDVARYYMDNNIPGNPSDYFRMMMYFIIGYSGFAFLLNLIREIQKDMADVKGDIRIQARTIPIVYGLKKSKIIVSILIVLTMLALVAVQQLVLSDLYSLLYLVFAVLLPLGISLWYNHRAVFRPDFVRAGNALKLAMLGGVIYTVVHYYLYYASEMG